MKPDMDFFEDSETTVELTRADLRGTPIWKSIPKPPPRMKCVQVTITKPDGTVDSRRWYGFLVSCIHRAAREKNPGCAVQFGPWSWED